MQHLGSALLCAVRSDVVGIKARGAGAPGGTRTSPPQVHRSEIAIAAVLKFGATLADAGQGSSIDGSVDASA